MRKLRVGVLGCSEFAGRAMLPAMKETPEIELAAAASRDAAKAREFARRFGCDAVEGYDQLLKRADIDAVYVPLPPGLHAQWVSRCLDAGKHVLVEKSFTTNEKDAACLLEQARKRRLLIMENFLFPHHSQYAWVRRFLDSGAIGPVSNFRTTFTTPPRPSGDIRYQAALGGGALLDIGTYAVRFALAFLGEPLTVESAGMVFDPARGIDLSGTARLSRGGQILEAAYSIEAPYQCTWEFVGAAGKLLVERGFSPPPGFAPGVVIERPEGREKITLPSDNHYQSMCRYFSKTILESAPFEPHWDAAARQAKYLEQIRRSAAKLLTSKSCPPAK